MSSNRQRRQDLDILRGVAVVGVVAYHYFPLRFSQGLNGVDVFLVISGYLVTQSLLELQPIRAPSLLKFYFRRIRRTVPALVATLTCCLTLAFFTLNDYQLRQLARSSFYAVTFQINFSLHYSIDYFNPDNRTNPLMHLWSLALEEQFYLVLPAMIWLLFKIQSVRKRFVLLLISTSVLVFAPFLTNQDSVFNSHYLPQARAWPLMIGVTIATTKFRFSGDAVRLSPQKLKSTFLRTLGIALVIICAFTDFLPNDIRAQRIIVCALTAMVIASGNLQPLGNWRGFHKLSYFGTRSYGLYLVHWPLLAITIGAVGREPTRIEKLALVSLSVLFAEILHQLVEKRFLLRDLTQRFLGGLIVIHILAGFVTFTFMNIERLPNRPTTNGTRGAFIAHYQNLAADWSTGPELKDGHRNHSCKLYLNQLIEDSTSPESIISQCDLPPTDLEGVVWGDSFALALGFGVMQLGLENQSVFVMHADSCPPILKRGTIPNSETSECLRSNELAMNLIERISPSWVILSQRQAHEVNNWENLVAWLRSLNSSMKVIVAGPVPQFEDDLPRTITTKYWLKFPYRMKIGEDVIIEHQATDNLTQRKVEKLTDVSYVSIFRLFCDSDSCRYRLDGHEFGGLVTWDSGHLTHYASKYVAHTLLKPLIQVGEE